MICPDLNISVLTKRSVYTDLPYTHLPYIRSGSIPSKYSISRKPLLKCYVCAQLCMEAAHHSSIFPRPYEMGGRNYGALNSPMNYNTGYK